MGVYPWSIAAVATIARLNLEVLEIRRLVLFRFRGSLINYRGAINGQAFI